MSPARTLTLPVPGAHHTLEARLTSGPSTTALAIVAPPHPLYGGTIGNPVVRTLERAFQAAGLGTLAFNFRGTGESGGEPSGDLDDARTDYLAALAGVPALTASVLSGYSFGGVAALEAALARSGTHLMMIAPPLALLDPAQLARFTGPLTVVVGSEDDYAPLEAVRELLDGRPRTTIEVLDGVEHFFLGSAVTRLAEVLSTLIPKEALGES